MEASPRESFSPSSTSYSIWIAIVYSHKKTSWNWCMNILSWWCPWTLIILFIYFIIFIIYIIYCHYLFNFFMTIYLFIIIIFYLFVFLGECTIIAIQILTCNLMHRWVKKKPMWFVIPLPVNCCMWLSFVVFYPVLPLCHWDRSNAPLVTCVSISFRVRGFLSLCTFYSRVMSIWLCDKSKTLTGKTNGGRAHWLFLIHL